jgi:hypothetical protein
LKFCKRLKNMKNIFYRKLVSLCLIVSLMAILSPIQIAQAGSLTSMSDTMTRLKAAQLSDHTILYTTPTGMSSGTIVIDFNTAGFVDGSVDHSDIDLSYAANGTDNEQTLGAAAGNNIWGAVFAANELTLTYPTSNGTAITAGWKVQIEIGEVATGGASNEQMTNPAAGDDKVIAITSGADSGSLAVSIASEDQVSITATVTPTLSFNVTDSAVALGNLSATVVQTDTAAMTASTNATGGYSITVIGPTLTSAASDTIDKIGDPAVVSIPGDEQFGMKIAVAGGGGGAAVSPYEDAINYAYDADVTADECASVAAPSALNTFTITYMANIETNTEAGSYSANHTYICTGRF